MRNLAIAAGLVLLLCFAVSPAVKADTTEIQDNYLVINGPGGNILGTSSEYSPSGSGTGYSYSSTGFTCSGSPTTCPYGTDFTDNAYGTYTVKLTAATGGSYFIGAYFDAELSLPFYNEYASINGSAGAGQSWEVGSAPTVAVPTSPVQTATFAGTLNDTNGIPMGTSNFLGTGTNGDVAFAMGFTETLVAGAVETVTFTIAPTSSGGFSIEQTHPTDGTNTGAPINAFFSGTESVVNPCTPGTPGCGGGGGNPGVPEPSSLMLLGTSLCGLLGLRKKFSN